MMARRLTSPLLGLLLLFVWTTAAIAGTPRSLVFEPLPVDGVVRFYSNGVPAAVVDSGPTALAVSLDLVTVASRPYVRLWMYVCNRSDETLELVPQSNVWLQGLGDEYQVVSDFYPTAPTIVLKHIDENMLNSMSAAFLGGLVSTIGARLGARNSQAHLSVSGDGGSSSATITVHDAAEKAAAASQAIGERTAAQMASLEHFYNGLKSNVASSCLRRNTLRPGESASGFLYFDYGRPQTTIHLAYGKTRRVHPAPSDLRYTARIQIVAGHQTTIDFLQQEGE